jgi:proline dehydrogenase
MLKQNNGIKLYLPHLSLKNNMISFDNTEVAFKHKSNAQLKKAYWLFKMVGSPALVKLGKTLTVLSFKLYLPIKGLVKKNHF